jgi:hypothetical protein
LFVTNLLADSRVHAALLAHAAADPRTALAVVDEANALADGDCARFRFVIRVGFAHYTRDKHPGSPIRPLWWQPPNALLVPLGAPAMFAVGDRPLARRAFAAAFVGHALNVNRKLMLAGLRELPGQSLVHELDQSAGDLAPPHSLHQATQHEEPQPPQLHQPPPHAPSPAAPCRVKGAQRSAWLADAALAPSPPGNNHPECHRTYEALEAVRGWVRDEKLFEGSERRR